MSTLSSSFGDLLGQLSTHISGVAEMPIVEFAEQIVFNGDIKLFPQQRAILRAFYNEPLDQQDIDMLSQWASDDRTTWVRGRQYSALVIEAGRRSGKTSVISIIILKEFYDLLNLANPSRHYGLLPSDPIAIFIFSQTLDQVGETLFKKLRGWATYSHYFKKLEEMGVIELLMEQFRCEEKNVGVYAKHTNTAALVGYSLKLIVLDEVARFSTNDRGQNTGDLIWSNVGAGTSTFGAEGRKIAISSAWHEKDNIQRLWELSKKTPNILGFRLRTFDMNPKMTRDNPIVVADYAEDPVKAALEWEGIRSSGGGNYISDLSSVLTGHCAVDSAPKDIDKTVNGITRYYSGNELIRIEDCRDVSFGHVDYGLKKNAAAFAMCHAVEIESSLWGIQVDALLKWDPRIDDNGNLRMVSFENVEDLLKEIHLRRPFKRLGFDQYNSAATIQRLHAEGIDTYEASTANAEQCKYYDTFKELCNQGLVILPSDSFLTPEACSELTGIVIVTNGDKRRITHPSYGKDLADAIVNCVYECYKDLVNTGKMNQMGASILKVKTTNPSKPYGRQIITPKDLGIAKRIRQRKRSF